MTRQYLRRRLAYIFRIVAAGFAISAFGFSIPALASCSGAVCDSALAGAYVPPSPAAPTYSSYSGASSNYISSPASITYNAPTYIPSASLPSYSGGSYSPPVFIEPAGVIVASTATHFEGDEVVTRGQKQSFRPRHYYFEPSDYRSFKCRGKKCEFEFKGRTKKDARAVEVYLAEALSVAAGPAETYTNCAIKRRGDKVICKMRGDLSYLNTSVLRRELYGR